jgi:predicted NAD/FAD-dependent oxidoreductase
MTPQWSETWFDQPEEEALQLIRDELDLFLAVRGFRVSVLKAQLKKWRFSHPLKTYSKSHLVLDSEKRISLIGDGFGGASLMGAIRSAQSLLRG